MKTKNVFLLLCFVFFFQYSFSQENNNWEGVKLKASGLNEISGIEAFYKISECEGKKVVIIKFVNTNNFSAELSWFDAVFTDEKQWIIHDQGEKKKISIQATQTIQGKCNGNKILIVPVNNFTPVSNFNQYKLFDFEVKF